ncbi:ABC-2 type transport system ATP-binding protein [Williamsia limnetica]|jgi:ABC-2 type transport system ATP-binding protein|uniref:ABC-2 type transport system ATP-binding protein n=1 Tax=Williamsia limnetica TaxID=882452 RepID=A0A318RIR7_WILLI|nr:ATP-binding cassette domain-containing protein [Williamsia limnetica]PYE14732.1 ABC-2 type transport system ATP-binding protein [Williamsia limnetica]
MGNQSRLAIEATGLRKNYGSFCAVDGIDLAVPAGIVYAVLGPNGAGKTTTVRMLATLLRPDAGHATVFGYDVVRDATAVRSLIGVTGQYASVDEDLTAAENLMIFGKLLGLSRARAKIRAADLLEEFGLETAAGRSLKHFSGGMRRRLDLAASLISRPPLLFLDEPTTGLDPRTRAQMWSTIRRLVAAGSTVLLTTQYLEEADQLADRIAVIDNGRLVADGTADDLKAAVGVSTLMVALSDPTAAGKAAGIVAGFTRTEVTVSGNGGIAAPLDDLSFMPELLFALRAAGIELREITVQKPSLDEVFFAITGQPAEVSAIEKDAA